MAKTFTYEPDRKVARGAFPSDLYEWLLKRARRHNRSISRELVDIVEKTFEREQEAANK